MKYTITNLRLITYGVFLNLGLNTAFATPMPSVGQCDQAINLANNYLVAMENIERQRNESGNLSDADYGLKLKLTATYRKGLSIEQCLDGVPRPYAFYHCLLANNGSIVECIE